MKTEVGCDGGKKALASRRLFFATVGAAFLALPAAKAQAETLAVGSSLTTALDGGSTARAALEARIGELENLLDSFLEFYSEANGCHHVYGTSGIEGFEMVDGVNACLVFDQSNGALYWAERD